MVVDKKKFVKIIISIFTLIIVFLAPYGYRIDLGPGPNSITAMIWEYSPYYYFRYLTPLRYYIQFYIFRMVVLYYIIRFLQEKVSRKRVIIVGIINEIIPLILSIPGALILNSDGENLMPIIISIPILVLFDIFVVYLFPKIEVEKKQ
ncbi:MAG: hypothetical protein ACFFB0_00050 [Promethearchaeota archaeon]